tara:strand:+ start:558 stop:890 length:333 start_codon:yes stop_codon:yes gene_type:complete
MPYNAGDRIREEYVEALTYEDTGCEISDLCTTCPLPQCKHDDAIWYRRYKKLADHRNLFKDLQTSLINYSKLAKKYKCTPETVKRLHKQLLQKNIDLNTVEIIYIKTKEG